MFDKKIKQIRLPKRTEKVNINITAGLIVPRRGDTRGNNNKRRFYAIANNLCCCNARRGVQTEAQRFFPVNFRRFFRRECEI